MLTSMAHPLIIYYHHLLHASESTELVIQVTLGRANAETKNSQHVGRIGRLLRLVSIQRKVTNHKSTNHGCLRRATGRWRSAVAGRAHRAPRTRSTPRRRQVTVPGLGSRCSDGRRRLGVRLVVRISGGGGVGVLYMGSIHELLSLGGGSEDEDVVFDSDVATQARRVNRAGGTHHGG